MIATKGRMKDAKSLIGSSILMMVTSTWSLVSNKDTMLFVNES